MRAPTASRTLTAVLLAGLLLLGACSSDDASTDAGEPTTSEAGGPTTAPTGGEEPGAGATGPLERYADYETVSYDDPSHWVCRPDIDDDICDSSLDATVVEADGALTVEPFARAEDPAVDCFYVYPTISRDPTMFSDWELSDEEEGFVTLNQAGRLQSQCRLFAPGYRQRTLSGLASTIGGGGATEEEGDPYADVLDAFKTYMAQDNDGRGFVLVGHSQGTFVLNQLLQEEIDPNDDVRSLLVGAYLAGGPVAVPEGEVIGGDLQEVPLCTTDGEVGCVATWATFRAGSPPPEGAFFGAPRDGEGEAGCVSPASFAGEEAELDAYLPADAEASILSALGTSTEGKAWLDEGAEAITTPFVRLPGLVTGTCTRTDGFNYLAVTVQPDDGPRADDIPGDLTPEWGLHLVDVNLVMGDIVRQVEAQAAAYAEG